VHRDYQWIDQVCATSPSLAVAAERLGMTRDALKSLRKRLRALDPSRPSLKCGRKRTLPRPVDNVA
jgi:hypothetical protein